MDDAGIDAAQASFAQIQIFQTVLGQGFHYYIGSFNKPAERFLSFAGFQIEDDPQLVCVVEEKRKAGSSSREATAW